MQSEESDIEVKGSDIDVRSKAVPLLYSSDSDDLSEREIFTGSHIYTESWTNDDKAPNIPNFIAESGPKIFPANK